jgi:hypothetical protein
VVLVLECRALCGRAEAQALRQDLDGPLNARSSVSCPSPELYSPLRPDPEGTPTVVGVALLFQDISRLDDVEQTMTANIYVALRWHDPRLADAGRGEGSANCPIPGKELWVPLIEPENLRSRQLLYDKRFLVDADGTVTLMRRVLVEIANPLDLHDFPFDQHQFQITLWATFSEVDEIVFQPLNRWLVVNPSLSLLGWEAGAAAASVRESARIARSGMYSRYDLVIEFARDWSFHALKLGVPLILIVLMAYAVYFLPPTAVAQQVAVGMTSMLTLVAYMLALGSSLPKISYLTRMDQLFVGCAVLVFISLVKAILTTKWVQQEATNVIHRVDILGRWLYPIALLLVMLIALVL